MIFSFSANKSNLKLLENWGCPSQLNHEAPGSTVSNKRSNVEWQHRARVDSADHGTSIHDSPSLDFADQPLSFWGYHSPHTSSPLTLVHAIAVLVTASLLVAMMVLGLVSYKLSVGSCVNWVVLLMHSFPWISPINNLVPDCSCYAQSEDMEGLDS